LKWYAIRKLLAAARLLAVTAAIAAFLAVHDPCPTMVADVHAFGHFSGGLPSLAASPNLLPQGHAATGAVCGARYVLPLTLEADHVQRVPDYEAAVLAHDGGRRSGLSALGTSERVLLLEDLGLAVDHHNERDQKSDDEENDQHGGFSFPICGLHTIARFQTSELALRVGVAEDVCNIEVVIA
jgi:hypothetical protein